jgi:hypothetical protein
VTFKIYQRRLELLESKSSYSDGVLIFADSSTRAVTFRDTLGVLCAAMSRCSHAGPGICEGSEQIPHQTEWHLGPRPTSKFDAAIDLIGRAVRIESDDRFLQLVHSTCQQAVELEAARNKEVATQEGNRAEC